MNQLVVSQSIVVETETNAVYLVEPARKGLRVTDVGGTRYSAVVVGEKRESLCRDSLSGRRKAFITHARNGQSAVGFTGTKATVDVGHTLRLGWKLYLFRVSKKDGTRVRPDRLTTNVVRTFNND